MKPLIGKPVVNFTGNDWDAFISKRTEIRAIRIGQKKREAKPTLARLAKEMGIAKSKLKSIIETMIKENPNASKA